MFYGNFKIVQKEKDVARVVQIKELPPVVQILSPMLSRNSLESTQISGI
jgi:hypothetical protein